MANKNRAANKVYLAGSIHSGWQENVMMEIPTGLRFFSPVEHGLIRPEEYTAWDLAAVRKSDIVFAYMEYTNPSGYGLSIEVGYGKALGKLVILVDDKSDFDTDFSRHFMFVRHTADVVFNTMTDGIRFLRTFALQ